MFLPKLYINTDAEPASRIWGIEISSDSSGNGHTYIDTLRDNGSTQAIYRIRTRGTPINYMVADGSSVSLPQGDTTVEKTATAGTASFTVRHNTDSTNAKAKIAVVVSGAASDDAWTTWGISGGQFVSLGIDNSVAGDPMVCSYSATLGTSDIWRADGTSFRPQIDIDMAATKVVKVNGTQVLTSQQTGMGASLTSRTAGATYDATAQTMLQEAHDKIRLLEAKLKTHGIVAT